tara:strand:- start:2380 stop:3996 length:1617 start_codon:yes stop_codon:yes gene_type:complete
MATGSRTLKLSILGDVTNLNKSLKTADNDVNSFAGGLEKFSARAGKAFALAGAAAVAYAGKLAIDGVKAAIEDEAAQAKLAKTLENVTGATDKTVKATEDYILQTSLAFGVTDEELRPSLERLVRATKDVEEAQKLQSLALDISAGSGKSLESVSNALAKAAEGQTTALGKLGVGIDAADLKTMSLDKITKTLSDTFGGQAQAKTETYQGKMDKLKVAFDEAKESVGTALLPIITKMADYISTNVVPALNTFIAGLTGKDSLNASLTKSQETALAWGKRIRSLIGTVIKFKDELIFLGATIGTIFVVSAIAGWVTATVAGIRTLIVAYNLLKTSAIVAGVASAFALNPLLGVGAAALAAGVLSAAAYVANRADTQAPGSSSDLSGMESTGLSAGLYGSTPVNPGASKTTIPGAGVGGLAAPSVATTAAQSAIDNSNAKTLADINKLQKDVDKKMSAANAALDAANLASVKADAFLTPDPSVLGNRSSALTRTEGNIYNVTVNGAIDSESTARQIVTLLNDSQARGTLGASGLVGAVSF